MLAVAGVTDVRAAAPLLSWFEVPVLTGRGCSPTLSCAKLGLLSPKKTPFGRGSNPFTEEIIGN